MFIWYKWDSEKTQIWNLILPSWAWLITVLYFFLTLLKWRMNGNICQNWNISFSEITFIQMKLSSMFYTFLSVKIFRLISVLYYTLCCDTYDTFSCSSLFTFLTGGWAESMPESLFLTMCAFSNASE